MPRTISSVSRALKVSSPRARLPRPLRMQSLVLSAGVPRNRWAGLQHGGLSQEWHADMPTGRAPMLRESETREAVWNSPLATANCPYPARWRRAAHSQHSSGPPMSTFDQNLSRNVWSTLLRSSTRPLTSQPPAHIGHRIRTQSAHSLDMARTRTTAGGRGCRCQGSHNRGIGGSRLAPERNLCRPARTTRLRLTIRPPHRLATTPRACELVPT